MLLENAAHNKLRRKRSQQLFCVRCDCIKTKQESRKLTHGKVVCIVCDDNPELAVELMDGTELITVEQAIDEGFIKKRCSGHTRQEPCSADAAHKPGCYHFDCYDDMTCAKHYCKDHCPGCYSCGSHSQPYYDGVQDGLYGEGADL